MKRIGPLLIVAVLAAGGCGDGELKKAGADGGADGDVDGDADGDGDSDSDADAGSPWSGPGSGRCDDGVEAMQLEFAGEPSVYVGESDISAGVEVCDGFSHVIEPVECVSAYHSVYSPENPSPECECAEGETCVPNADSSADICVRLCTSTDDCADDELCLCALRGVFDVSAGGFAIDNWVPRCVPAECRSSSACADGLRCGIVTDDCDQILRTACHTPDDACEGSGECAAGQRCTRPWEATAYECVDWDVSCD